MCIKGSFLCVNQTRQTCLSPTHYIHPQGSSENSLHSFSRFYLVFSRSPVALCVCISICDSFIFVSVCLSLNTRVRGIHCKLPLMLILSLYLLLVKILSSYSHVGNKAGSTHCMWTTAMLPTG